MVFKLVSGWGRAFIEVMKWSWFPQTVLAGFSMLFLCSCLTESTHPLSDEKQATPDLRLEGDWVTGDHSPVYLHFLKSDDHLMTAVYVEHPESLIVWEEFPTRINQLQILNFRSYHKDSAWGIQSGHYFFMRYEFPDRNTLKLWGPDNTTLSKLIRQRELQGRVKISKKPTSFPDDDVLITASSQKLREYLATHPADRFFSNDPMVFKRIKTQK
ncbi:MAG: hypothetical protein QM796_06075 [Chthoniobacteraceae bacterium]